MSNTYKQQVGDTFDELIKAALKDTPPKRGKRSRLRHANRWKQEDAVVTMAQRLTRHNNPTLVSAFLMCPIEFKPPTKFFDVLGIALETEILITDKPEQIITDLATIWTEKVNQEPTLRTNENMQPMAFLGAVKNDTMYWETPVQIWN